MTVTGARLMTRVATRVTARVLFVCALGLLALLIFGGRAHALTDPPPDAQPASNDASVATAPPVESPAPPSAPVAEPTPPTPAAAGGPDNTNDQDSSIVTTGTGTANTGGNTAVATSGSTTDPATTTPPPSSTTATSGANASTGTSAATGDQSTSKIGQQVNASASDSATVEILQIALVVNVGIAHSTTGDNLAGSTATGGAPVATGSTGSADHTGNANATGNNAHTGIVQGATVGNGESSSQTSTVLNIGIAISNTGINVTIASIGAGSATAVGTTGPDSATVMTGDARATGDRATSTIGQTATASASGSALVTIDQRAIVVNFGIALSNTGGNFALASFDPSALTPEQLMIVNALLGSLAPLVFGAQLTMPGSSVALASTGNATGVGNTSVTTILQTATGTATGSSTASATQVAQVGNLGLAIANTGLNGAFASSSAPASSNSTDIALAQTESSLGAFFALITNPDWLSSSNPFAAFAQTVQINGVTLDLGGSLSATDLFAGLENATAPTGDNGPGVHVVQISGVLNIGVATSDSGNNTVISTVTGATTADGPTFSTHVATTDVTPTVGGRASGARAGALLSGGTQRVRAMIVSGNATSVGNLTVVTTCQAFHDSVCTPPPPPPSDPPPTVTPEPTPRPVPQPVVVVNAPEPATPGTVIPQSQPQPVGGEGTLPLTGANTSTLAGIGASLLAIGVALCRRRKSVAGGRQPFVSGD